MFGAFPQDDFESRKTVPRFPDRRARNDPGYHAWKIRRAAWNDNLPTDAV